MRELLWCSLGFLGASVVWLMFDDRSRGPRIDSTQVLAEATSDLARQVEHLASAVRDDPGFERQSSPVVTLAAPAPAAVALERQPVVDDLGGVAAQLQALRRDIRGFAHATRQAVAAVHAVDPGPIRVQSVLAYAESYARGPAAARQLLLLQSMAQVAERFGKPTQISVSSRHVKWDYTTPDRTRVKFTFHDGLVVSATSSTPQ